MKNLKAEIEDLKIRIEQLNAHIKYFEKQWDEKKRDDMYCHYKQLRDWEAELSNLNTQLEAEQSDKLQLEDFLPTFENNDFCHLLDGATIFPNRIDTEFFEKGFCFKIEKEALYFSRRSIVLRLVDRMMLKFNVGERPKVIYLIRLFNTSKDTKSITPTGFTTSWEFNYLLEPYFYNAKVAEKCLEFLSGNTFEDGSKYIDYLILKNPLT